MGSKKTSSKKKATKKKPLSREQERALARRSK